MNRMILLIVLLIFVLTAAQGADLPAIALERDGSSLTEVSVTAYGAILVEYEDHTGKRSGYILASSSKDESYHRLGGNLLNPTRDKYFYLETPDREALRTDNFMYPPYYDLEDDLRPDQPVPAFGDRIMFHLRIHPLSGKMLKTIPIEEPYAAAYNSATWLSKRWISITKLVRDWPSYTLLVDTVSGRKHVSGVDFPMTTLDGDNVFFCHQGVVYFNFTSVYPVAGEPLLDVGSREGWEQYRRRYKVNGEVSLNSRLREVHSYVQECVLTPDGRHIAALDMRTFTPQLLQGQAPTLAEALTTAPVPVLAFLDVGALKRGERTDAIVQTMELPKDETLELDIEKDRGLVVDRDEGEIIMGKGMPVGAAKL